MNSLENHKEIFSCNIGRCGELGKDAVLDVGWICVDTKVFVTMQQNKTKEISCKKFDSEKDENRYLSLSLCSPTLFNQHKCKKQKINESLHS